MENHVRILGILNLIWGGMGLIVLVVILLVFVGGFFALGLTTGEEAPFWLAGAFGTLFGIIMLVSALPSILAGYGLLKKRSWGRFLAIILAVLELPAFPFGTALGIYTLIVLLHADSSRIFEPDRTAVHQPAA